MNNHSFETIKSFVNTWECDENNHMNVQFYYDRFDTMDQHFELQSGFAEMRAGPRLTRHVRYHRELFVATPMVGYSQIISNGPHAANVLHVLKNLNNDEIAATAIDGYGQIAQHEMGSQMAPDLALPRGLDAQPVSLEARDISSYQTVFYTKVENKDCKIGNELSERGYISYVTDAASHAWGLAGVTSNWLNEHGFGRVAVEMKLTYNFPPKLGDLLVVKSRPFAVSKKTFGLEYLLVDPESEKIAAILEAVALVMDLQTRKVVELPPEILSTIDGFERA